MDVNRQVGDVATDDLIDRRRSLRHQPGAALDDMNLEAGPSTTATQDFAERFDTLEASADNDDGDIPRSGAQAPQPFSNRVALGDALERHRMLRHTGDAVVITDAAERQDTIFEADSGAVVEVDRSRFRIHSHHPGTNEAVAGVRQDLTARQTQVRRLLHPRDQLVNVGKPLEARLRVDDDHIALRR